MIYGENILRTYRNIWKVATGQGDDCTTGCLLDYLHFEKYYKSIAIDLSKQENLEADQKTMQQVNFTSNLNRDGNIKMFFIIEETGKIILDFSQGTERVF